jgi:hypothetical protein
VLRTTAAPDGPLEGWRAAFRAISCNSGALGALGDFGPTLAEVLVWKHTAARQAKETAMMTALEMLQTFGLVLAVLLGRAVLVVGVVALFSVPFVAYAYAARAVSGCWARHHRLAHAHHRA